MITTRRSSPAGRPGPRIPCLARPGLRRARAAGLGLLLAATSALLTAGRPATAEEETPPAPPPPPAPSAPADPAALSKRATATALLERISRHAVAVSIRFQKDLEAEVKGAIPPNPRSTTEQYRAWRMSYLVPGFVVRDRRTVVVSDLWLPPGAIASITVRPPGGPEVAGHLRGFLRRATGVVLETEADLDAEPVPFPERMTVTIDTPLHLGSLGEGPDGLELWLEGLGGTRRRPVGRKGFAYGHPESVNEGLRGLGDDASRTVDLVMDERGTPLGFRFGGTVDLGNDVWMGPDVLEDVEVPMASLRERAEALRDTSSFHRVKVNFRVASRHDRQRNPFSSEDTSAEAEFWGLAVTPDTLLVIGRLTDEQVRKIETLRLQDEDDHGTEARYAGRLRGYDAFLVKIPGGGLAPLAAEAAPVPAIGEALLVHNVAWRGGARRDQVDYNRIVGWGRGYGDRRFLATERAVPEGAVLRTLDGKVLGFAARLSPEDREQPLTEGRSRADRESPYPPVAVLFVDSGLPASYADDPDTRLMPQEEAEAKRLPWIGVEYDAIARGVAELMAVSEATYDGARGLIVTQVYPDSPAETIGLEDGDVLLSVRKTSGPGSDAPPVDLRDRDEGGFGGFPFSFSDDAAPAPWRSQSNTLTRLLQTWGVGTEFQLEVLRSGQVVKHDLKVEFGPPDFHSAPRAKDEGTGLSFRDLTYEVKAALRMAKDATGVVVSRVEPGSAAAQARIAENELILELEGQPVKDAATFLASIEADRKAGKPQVRLVVRRLGKTRLVDVSLTAPEGARGSNEEGSNEEGSDDAEPPQDEGEGDEGEGGR